MSNLVNQFATLFAGNPDVVGAWWGACLKEPLTTERYHRHLSGVDPIGVYPMRGDDCAWGCVDIDAKAIDPVEYLAQIEEGWNTAQRLKYALDSRGIPSHIERSNNGWHVWVFPEDMWVPAVTMRRALLAACKVIGYSPKEVNPKAERLDGITYGNYVRLPYPGGGITRYIVDERGQRQRLHDWMADTFAAGLASVDVLRTSASLWTPPERARVLTYDHSVRYDIDGLSPYVKRMLEEGPLPGADRSTTYVRLAYKMAEDGTSPTDAYAALCAADQRWGKNLLARGAPGEHELQKIIDRAYS